MRKKFTVGIAMLISLAIPFQTKAEIDDFEGYQGFVDVGYTFGTGEYGLNSIDLLTSHGIQIIPAYLYTGIGTGLQYFHEAEKCAIPLYANIRSCFLADENVSPFADLKLGYAAIPGNKGRISDGGLFLSPSIGCSFVVKDYIALNAGIGYTYEQVKINTTNDRKNIGGFFIRLGCQF